MGGLLVALLVVLILGTALLAYASYRRHSRAARARSNAALSALLTEAYELEHGVQAAGDDAADPSDPSI